GAMPARVQRKDAEILRHELNCTIVRCSHYPQHPAFLDACDELGLLVWDEAPGWQYLGDTDWLRRSYDDVGGTIARDRNHPCVVVWGVRLNETADDTAFYTHTQQLAHQLDDSRQTTGGMFALLHDTQDFQQDVFGYNDYDNVTDPDGRRQPKLRPPRMDLPYLVSEAVGTLSGPARFYRRTDPVLDQQGQALAHAMVHDQAAADERYAGVITWCGYDYPSGNGNVDRGIKWPGVVDVFREPKLGAAFYAAQVDPACRVVVEPAFYWDFSAKYGVGSLGGRAAIFANADRLELYVGGRHFASLAPDRQNFGHVRYPPFFADFGEVDSFGTPELRIDAYIGARLVLSRSFSADPASDRLVIAADDAALSADGSDATRIALRVTDRYGAPRPSEDGTVSLRLSGPAMLVGDNPFPLGETGGAGAVWLRTIEGSRGLVRVEAEHSTLGPATASVTVEVA
ncbi:MAG: beta-galactosidase, partial [Kutzneria sp.]|nr:beta-galactosidase [Kutzneria sp.]